MAGINDFDENKTSAERRARERQILCSKIQDSIRWSQNHLEVAAKLFMEECIELGVTPTVALQAWVQIKTLESQERLAVKAFYTPRESAPSGSSSQN